VTAALATAGAHSVWILHTAIHDPVPSFLPFACCTRPDCPWRSHDVDHLRRAAVDHTADTGHRVGIHDHDSHTTIGPRGDSNARRH
jgi:hypothetical protein